MESHPTKTVTAKGLGIALFVSAWMWVAGVAPAAMTFAISVATAVGWCFWLDKHPE